MRISDWSSDVCSSDLGVAHGAVVALHVGVLLRLARLDVLDPDVLSFRPVQKRAADVLGAVVAADPARLAAPFTDLLQRPAHPPRRQRPVALAAQALAVAVVHPVEQPAATAIATLVVRTVHSPQNDN